MSSIIDDVITCDRLVTPILTLNDKSVNTITDDPTNRSTKVIPSSNALFIGLNNIQTQLNTLLSDVNKLPDPVISLPLVSPIFADNGYEYSGWNIAETLAIYTGDADNYLKLPTNLFSVNSHYILNIKVNVLPTTGNIELRNKNEDTIFVITQIGDYYVDVESDDVACSFKLVATGIEYGSNVIISYLALHKVLNTFYFYLFNKIAALSELDGGGYVDKVMFEIRMAEVAQELETINANLATESLVAHINDHLNPHQVTYTQIGAAAEIHTHGDLYFSKEETTTLISNACATRALLEHTHDQYVETSEVDDLISTQLAESFKNIVTVLPLSMLNGPVGILPENYIDQGISYPVQTLITNNFNPDVTSEFDFVNGLCSSNAEPIDDTLTIYAFTKYSIHQKLARFHTDNLNMTNDIQPILLHYQFHRIRKIIGYKIRSASADALISKWSFYINFNTFVHNVQTNTYSTAGYEITLPEAVSCNSVTFELLEVMSNDFGINIEFIFADLADGEIGITEQPLLFSIPRSGNNLIYTLDLENITNITPTIKIENLPLYIYVDIDDQTIESLHYTHIPPEYGIIRTGNDVFRDKYILGLSTTDPTYNPYLKLIHPIFGNLELLDCLENATDIANIYITDESWISPDSQKYVNFVHTFIEPTFISGYSLEWDKTYIDKLPTDWILTLETVDENDNIDNVIIDSVITYGSKTNYNNNMVLYNKRFDKSYKVNKMTLYLNNNKETGLFLTNFKPLLTHDFYSIPRNTMYCGNTVVNRIYLGEVKYVNGSYDVTNGLVIGGICTIPINNLNTTDFDTIYTVKNPFYTTDVDCNIKVIGGDMANQPMAWVMDIQASEIKVKAYSTHIFSLSIVRNW